MMFWLKDLIKYNKVNRITSMTIRVEIARPKLFALRKQQFNEVAKLVDVHVWQLGKKNIGPFSHVITNFFGATNPYQKK